MKDLSKIVIGGMRFKNRASAVRTIRKAIDCGFNYIDTAPCYCLKSDIENSESWVGTAVNHPEYRNRIMVSTKCSPGNGGLELGDFLPQKGFGARNRNQLLQVFNQSLKRLNMGKVEYYHLWTVHTMEQLNEALKESGWLSGVNEMKEKWKHLGITSHADSDTLKKFLDTGLFEILTIPLNILNNTRINIINYCNKKGIKVIAMNPFAGGILAKKKKIRELALLYLLKLDNVHPLIGFSNPGEVVYAKKILDKSNKINISAEELQNKVRNEMKADTGLCTACGYCLPCPQDINIGAALSYYNMYKYLGIRSAKKKFKLRQWYDALKIDKCNACGQCEKKCPNALPVISLIEKAKSVLYK